MTLKNHRLLTSIIVGLTAYWIVGAFLPGIVLSVALGTFAVLIGLAILIQYARGAYRVLLHGARSEAEDGAHLAAIGIPAIAAAIVYGGLFAVAWNIAGQPESWIGTPAANFSRLLLTLGCTALYLTPEVEQQRIRLPGVIWLVLIMLTAVITAFVLGAYVGRDSWRDDLRWRVDTSLTCQIPLPNGTTLTHFEAWPPA